MPLIRSYERKTATAAADTPFQVVIKDRWYNFADIMVYDNDLYVGDVSSQDVLVAAGDVYTITSPVNIFDFFFKNEAAGANGRVVVAGTPMTQKQADAAGLGVKIEP